MYEMNSLENARGTRAGDTTKPDRCSEREGDKERKKERKREAKNETV